MPKTVAIIGAGASGLPCIRHSLLYGFEPFCFEATNDIGGLWNFKADRTDESASVMKTTIINSSKEMTAYSDFPPKKEYSNFMHNTKMLQYFREYADHFHLLKHVNFNHKVVNVTKSKNGDKEWLVEYTDGSGAKLEKCFDCVLVCTGHHKIPNLPTSWPNQHKFKGEIIHSHDYKVSDGFQDKRVVCVGVGNSGLDIAVELSRVGKQVYLSTRRGTWVFNRISEKGKPIDIAIGSRMRRGFMNMIPQKLTSKMLESICNSRFDHAAYGLKPDFSPLAAHISINDDLPNRIASGTLKVVPDILDFNENEVIFKDGTRVEADVVIFSTGYKISFPLLDKGQLIKVKDNWVRLYKRMFVPTLEHPTLAVIGLIQPLGSIMPISEMQARVFFAAQSGECRIPNKSEMEQDVLRQEACVKARFVASPRHTIQVDYTVYMDELANMIGCKPDHWHLAKTDPKLAFYSFYQANVPYNYRLVGPHRWEGAREAVLSLSDRTGFKEVQSAEIQSFFIKLALYFILLAVVLAKVVV